MAGNGVDRFRIQGQKLQESRPGRKGLLLLNISGCVQALPRRSSGVHFTHYLSAFLNNFFFLLCLHTLHCL